MDKLIDEEEAMRWVMRKLKCTEDEARSIIERAVRAGELTPVDDFTEADRQHWRMWKNLN